MSDNKMKVFILFGQRVCSYDGEFGLEALYCMSEYEHADNPEYLKNKLVELGKTGAFEKLSIILLGVDECQIRRMMFPEHQTVAAVIELGYENQDAKDCACADLGSQCDVCDDEE